METIGFGTLYVNGSKDHFGYMTRQRIERYVGFKRQYNG